MNNIILNHNNLLYVIFQSKYTEGYAEITNKLDKEWEYIKNSEDKFKGQVVIKALGGVLTIYFKKDGKITFLTQGDLKQSQLLAEQILCNYNSFSNTH